MSEPTPYATPWLKLDIDYDNTGLNGVLKPIRLTIHNSLSYDINTRWVLYYTDIPCIEQLSWLIRATPPIVTKYLTEKFTGSVSAEIQTKLDSLIRRFSQIEPLPQPEMGESFVQGVFYTKSPFVPLDSIAITIEMFINKILTELNFLKDLKVEDSTIPDLHSVVVNMCRGSNDFVKYLNRNYEDFFIFLRVFRDLSKYLLMREIKVSVYQIEKEQVTRVKQNLRFGFKKVFPLLQKHHILCIYADALTFLLNRENQ